MRRLAVLREFAARGTVSGAAEALGYTPSAVSQQLAQLQREAGVRLLRRSGRRLELTDPGRVLAGRAEELLASMEVVEAELAAHAGEVRGRVRLAAFQTAGLSLVAPALGRLEEHPGLRVEFAEAEGEESLPALAAGGFDVVVAEEYGHAPRPRLAGVAREYLEPDPMLIALPCDHPALPADGPVSLAELSECEWATARAGSAYADMFVRLCRSVGGFEPRIRHRAHDMLLLLELVARGCAALLPALGHPELDGRVAARPLAEGSFSRDIFVAFRESDRNRPSTAAVVEALRR